MEEKVFEPIHYPSTTAGTSSAGTDGDDVEKMRKQIGKV